MHKNTRKKETFRDGNILQASIIEYLIEHGWASSIPFPSLFLT